MAKEIIWTPQAERTFAKVIKYLEEEWTEKEVEKFIVATENVKVHISQRPEMFRKSSKEGIHEALVTKHNLLLYKIKEKTIDLITFWDTRQHPKKKSRK